MIYIIWGLSGPLKRLFVDSLDRELAGKTINQKASTRGEKEYDGKEMISFSKEEEIPEDEYPKNYRYQQYGQIYAINKKQIDECVKENKDHFIICHDFNIINILRKDYKESVRVIYLLFFDIDGVLNYINRTKGYKDEKEERIKKIYNLQRKCGEKDAFFEKIIPLYHFSDFTEAEKLMWRYIKEYVMGIQNDINMGLKKEETDYPQKYGFIIMPFESNHNNKGVRKAFDSVASCIQTKDGQSIPINRVDEQLYGSDRSSQGSNRAITENIYQAINDATFVIADLTDNRPNCYYELGYARALKKPVVVVANKKTKLEFDERDKSYISYSTENNHGQPWNESLAYDIEERLKAICKEIKIKE